jgi:hypothetical protein
MFLYETARTGGRSSIPPIAVQPPNTIFICQCVARPVLDCGDGVRKSPLIREPVGVDWPESGKPNGEP